MTGSIIGAVVAAFLLLPVAAAEAKVEYFAFPDVRKDFCGSKISAQYCKCAFHGELCGATGGDQSSASAKVNTEFDAFVATKIETFARTCMQAGGIYGVVRKACEYCESGKVRSNGVCANPNETRSIEEIYNLPKVETTGGTGTIGWVVDGEGEFFVFSPGRKKWIGPVTRGLTLFEGDVLYTTQNGRARLKLWNANVIMPDRTQIILPSPTRQRTLLERGAVYIWESVKRLATNQPLEIEEGGAHSITAIKGTKFFIEVSEEAATYTVNEGLIAVWKPEIPTLPSEVKAGESVRVTASGVETTTVDWDTLIAKYQLADQDHSEPTVVAPVQPIDPDAVNPPEAAYSGDLVGILPPTNLRAPKYWLWLLPIGVTLGLLWYARKLRGAKVSR